MSLRRGRLADLKAFIFEHEWKQNKWLMPLLALILAVGAISAGMTMAMSWPAFSHVSYTDSNDSLKAAVIEAPVIPVKPMVVHLPSPIPVKAVYITACTASESKLRDKVVGELAGTEINSMVIDIKDYSGTVSYASTSVAVPPGGNGCRIIDLPEFVQELHDKGIYRSAGSPSSRIRCIRTRIRNLAVASLSHPSRPWTDKSGLSYVDPDSKAYWDYIVAIAKEAYSIGFDEINFDYIRFPSDGDMSDAHFALPASTTKAMVIKEFFSYLHSQLQPSDDSQAQDDLKGFNANHSDIRRIIPAISSTESSDDPFNSPSGIKISADLFGQTTVNTDDMGIGQVMEDALPYFDFVDQMVYPSHFIDGFDGYANPAADPYSVVKFTMTRAVERAVAASSTPDKLRPWLQAFDYKAIYTPARVESEKQAVYDSGLYGWMLWNAASEYDVPELMPAATVATST